MNNFQIILTIFWSFLLPYPILFVFFYNKRKIYPIQGRFPRVALLEGILAFSFGTFHWHNQVFGDDCNTFDSFTYFFSLTKIHALMYRILQLLFCYEITKGITELKNMKNISEPNWYIRHRYLVKDNFVSKVITAQAIFYSLVYIILTFNGFLCQTYFQVVWRFFCILNVSICILMGIKIWGFPSDAYGIKFEFKCQVASLMTLMLAMVIIVIINADYIFIFNILVEPLLNLILITSILRPYLQTFSNNNQHSKLEEDSISLKHILRNRAASEQFTKYLESEFSTENIFFWLEVQEYKKISTSQLGEIKLKATLLFHKFVDPLSAPCQVNLSSAIRTKITEKIQILVKETTLEFQNVFFSIFDEAEIEIYRLMASHSFPRFQQTVAYSLLLKNGELSIPSQQTELTAKKKEENELENLLAKSQKEAIPTEPLVMGEDNEPKTDPLLDDSSISFLPLRRVEH